MDFGIKNNVSSGFSLNEINNQTANTGNTSQQSSGQSLQQFQMQQNQQYQAQQPQSYTGQMPNYQTQNPQIYQQPNTQQYQSSQPQGYNQPYQQSSQQQPVQQQFQQQQYQQSLQQQFQQPVYPPQDNQFPQQQIPSTMSNINQTQRPPATGVSLRKGQKVSLSKMNAGLDQVMVGLGWDVNPNSPIPYDLDVEVFMLGANDKVIGDDWFVFYNQLMSPDGSVKHSGDNRTGQGSGDDEVIYVQLSKVNPQVQKLLFIVTINEALERGHNFGQVSNAYIRIVDMSTNSELVRFNLTDYYSNVISMMVGEIYRHNNEWKFNPIGDGTGDDLMGLCLRYGVNVQ